MTGLVAHVGSHALDGLRPLRAANDRGPGGDRPCWRHDNAIIGAIAGLIDELLCAVANGGIGLCAKHVIDNISLRHPMRDRRLALTWPAFFRPAMRRGRMGQFAAVRA